MICLPIAAHKNNQLKKNIINQVYFVVSIVLKYVPGLQYSSRKSIIYKRRYILVVYEAFKITIVI